VVGILNKIRARTHTRRKERGGGVIFDFDFSIFPISFKKTLTGTKVKAHQNFTGIVQN
jgi:hypothetical protein